MKLRALVVGGLGLALMAPMAPMADAHRTTRTHYHTINGQRVWHKAIRGRATVHTRINGWTGHIARSSTLKNRNLVIDFDNGHRRTVEVPDNIVIREKGKQVSVHSLDSDQRVKVWAYRIPGAEGAWRATRLIAY